MRFRLLSDAVLLSLADGIEELRCFVRAADMLNFTRAAESLSIAQPALSRHIQTLEAELGFALFVRNSRKVELTAEGAVFSEDIREVLELLEAAESRARRTHQEAGHELVMGFAPFLAGKHISDIVKELKERDARIRIKLKDLSNLEMVEGVRSGSLDLALLPFVFIPENSQFVKIPMMEHPLEVAMSERHPLAKKKTVALEELASERLLAYSKKDYPDYHRLLQTVFRKSDFLLQVAEEYEDGSSLMASVQNDFGVAIISPASEGLPEGLITRPIKGNRVRFQSGILYHKKLAPELAEAVESACKRIASDEARG